MQSDTRRLTLYIASTLFSAGCSTTKHLSEGEILYTGQKTTIVKNRSTIPVGETTMEEVEAAFTIAPNNSLLDGSSIRIFFSIGSRIHNGLVKYEEGLGRWISNRLIAKPVLMPSVSPDIRQEAAADLLRDYSYFNGTVSYKIFLNPKDLLKTKIQYTVGMRSSYFIDTVHYRGFSERTLQIMNMSRRRSLINPGEQFSVIDLDGECTHINTLLRNMGYYHFRPGYLIYQVDITLVPGGYVTMCMAPVSGMLVVAEKPSYVGKRAFYLYGRWGQTLSDSMDYKGLRIYYHGKLRMCPSMAYRWLNYQAYHQKRQAQDSTGIPRRHSMQNLYSLYCQTHVQERLNNVSISRYFEVQYTPRDMTLVHDVSDVNIHTALGKPYSAEPDFNAKMKSNNQTGPGASFTVTKNDVFGGGEVWNVKLDGSYRWQVGRDRSSAMNSYEMGSSVPLMFPRAILPRLGDKECDPPAITMFRLYVDQSNRAKYYKLLAFRGNTTYDLQPERTSKYSSTPSRLTPNALCGPTEVFKELQAENPALCVSLRGRFIPVIEYMYAYDNAPLSYVRNPIWRQTIVSSAGNLTSCIYRTFGKPFGEQDKKLMGVPSVQFLKINSELHYHYRIDRNQLIASRTAGGVIRPYGNVLVVPYTEQFHTGGVNSMRAFPVRNMGPRECTSDKESKYSFINHVDDICLEVNVEYRLRIIGDSYGVVFLDAGNVWLVRKDGSRSNNGSSLKNSTKQIALGTDTGLRYDMDLLVSRLDYRAGLCDPYETGKLGYYNIPKFKDSLTSCFAIGYPS